MDCYERETEREAQTGSSITRVTDAVINPNRWSKMNVSNTIKANEHKTLAEISGHLYAVLRMPIKDQLCGDQFKVCIGYGKKIVIGFSAAVGEHLHKLMSSSKAPLPISTKADIVSFEWMAHVHGIFNNILMNTKEIIVDAKNIQVFEKQLNKSLDFFESLRCRQIERRDEDVEHWDATFLDIGKTWYNLRKT